MNEERFNNTRSYLVSSILDNDRIDCKFHDPNYFEFVEEMKQISDTYGYKLTSLNEVLSRNHRKPITGGATPKGAVYPPEGIPFIRIQNVTETEIDLSDAVFIEKRIHEGNLKRSQLQPRDVLLTITGTYGVSTVVPEGLGPANINQHMVRLVPNESKVTPQYLSMYLNSDYGRKQMARAVTGSSRLALDYPSIKNLRILRPDLDFQKRVIEEVQAIYREADDLQRKIGELEASYDNIVLSKLDIELPKEPRLKLFLSSIEHEDRLEVKWYYPYYNKVMDIIMSFKTKKLEKYRHKLKYGASISSDYMSDIPFLRIENLRRNFIEISDLKYVPSGVYRDQVASLYLQQGDILIERSGTYVGLCSYVPKGYESFVYGSYIIRLKLEDDRILPEYLSIYLNSILGRLQFDKLKTGSLQFNINLRHIRDTTIIQPEKDVQKEIATKVFKTIDKVKDLKNQREAKIKEAKNRFTELLHSSHKISHDS